MLWGSLIVAVKTECVLAKWSNYGKVVWFMRGRLLPGMWAVFPAMSVLSAMLVAFCNVRSVSCNEGCFLHLMATVCFVKC